MDIFLIWGFLGSGKTTFINYLLSSDYFSNKKTIIIENESGKESVDGEILKSSSFDVIDLKGGCACCSLKSKLIEVLNKLSMSHKTEIVVIEASGISSLEDMLHISFLNKSKIFSILDVTQYDFLKKLNYQFYRKQYSLSSTIVLTKTDAMNPCEVKNIVEELMSFNPPMRIISDYKNVRKNEWNEIFAVKNILLNRTAPILNNFRLPKFNIETFYFEDPIDYNFFYNYFEYIDKLFNNNIIRAKGLFKDNDKWIKFDYVGGIMNHDKVENYDSDKKGFMSVWLSDDADSSLEEIIRCFLEGREISCRMSDLELSKEMFIDYLGFNHLEPEIIIMLERLINEAISICKPRLGFRFITGKRKDKEHINVGNIVFKPSYIITKALQDSEFYILMLSSVGDELDYWVNNKRRGKDLMESYIADGIASAITEKIVDYGQMKIENYLGKWNIKVSNTYSPGYCNWDVSEQKKFFSLLPSGFCNVELLDSCLMLPIKSVSTLMGAGMNLSKKPYGCVICNNKDCYKRKI